MEEESGEILHMILERERMFLIRRSRVYIHLELTSDEIRVRTKIDVEFDCRLLAFVYQRSFTYRALAKRPEQAPKMCIASRLSFL